MTTLDRDTDVAEALARSLPMSYRAATPAALDPAPLAARRLARLVRIGLDVDRRTNATPAPKDVLDALATLDLLGDVGADVGMPAGMQDDFGSMESVGWVGVAEAARIAGTNRNAIHGRIARGSVRAIRDRLGQWLIDPTSIAPRRSAA